MNADFERVVQWYPGHMARAMRRIGERMALIDVVIEAVDGRAPRSDSNPMLDAVAGTRRRLLVLTREDLADPHATKAWLEHFARAGRRAIAVEGRNAQSVSRVARELAALCAEVGGVARAMVVGVPNSGKSSIINALLKRKAAKTADKAGVTRSLQWFRVAPNLELMDTPGILVPKIASRAAQWKLAMIGAVPRERYDPEEIAVVFHHWLLERYPRAKVPSLDEFARARGFARRGGEADLHNAAQSYIAAFNDGVFGRISLERPDDEEPAA